MAKDAKTDKPKDSYADVVERLEKIVAQLEGGTLSLEDSLERFAEGVQLVKRGEKLLTDAEARVEQLLSQDGTTGPLDAEEAKSKKSAKQRADSSEDDDDIDF